MLRFTKMNGAGNDFVMIDNRAGNVRLEPEQIVRICDRHRGVGADGILLLEKGSNGADFRMRYYNRDGGEAEMCGNGARCFARFATKIAGAPEKISLQTLACGARVVAEALIFAATEKVDGPISVTVRSGSELSVGFKRAGGQFTNVTLTGPAEFAFEGAIEV